MSVESTSSVNTSDRPPITQPAKNVTLFGDSNDDPSFWDFIDVINPLQHLPIINVIYREITGDKIGAGARVLGGALFGGIGGLGSAIVNLAVEEQTGQDIGANILALFTGDDDEAAPTGEVMLAQATGKPVSLLPQSPELAPQSDPLPDIDPGLAALAAPKPELAALPQTEEPLVQIAMAEDHKFLPLPGRGEIISAGEAFPLAAAQIGASRFMKLPERGAMPPRPTITPTITTTPPASPALASDTMRKALEAQGLDPASHPMLNGPDEGGWIADRMLNALDKYQQPAQKDKNQTEQ